MTTSALKYNFGILSALSDLVYGRTRPLGAMPCLLKEPDPKIFVETWDVSAEKIRGRLEKLGIKGITEDRRTVSKQNEVGDNLNSTEDGLIIPLTQNPDLAEKIAAAYIQNQIAATLNFLQVSIVDRPHIIADAIVGAMKDAGVHKCAHEEILKKAMRRAQTSEVAA